ncbi:hypothetical protein PoB_003069400 [Plakobranchus ocellatus]|uniref:Uncharacterized protein n=1 Tax=Plakobranchus ocellatus TaxID=259542 RepID=A0AAV4A953_9GAST|nr:hypothetical protein PoB_003069400 [Plakobranchus ocellatus]
MSGYPVKERVLRGRQEAPSDNVEPEQTAWVEGLGRELEVLAYRNLFFTSLPNQLPGQDSLSCDREKTHNPGRCPFPLYVFSPGSPLFGALWRGGHQRMKGAREENWAPNLYRQPLTSDGTGRALNRDLLVLVHLRSCVSLF